MLTRLPAQLGHHPGASRVWRPGLWGSYTRQTGWGGQEAATGAPGLGPLGAAATCRSQRGLRKRVLSPSTLERRRHVHSSSRGACGEALGGADATCPPLHSPQPPAPAPSGARGPPASHRPVRPGPRPQARGPRRAGTGETWQAGAGGREQGCGSAWLGWGPRGSPGRPRPGCRRQGSLLPATVDPGRVSWRERGDGRTQGRPSTQPQGAGETRPRGTAPALGWRRAVTGGPGLRLTPEGPHQRQGGQGLLATKEGWSQKDSHRPARDFLLQALPGVSSRPLGRTRVWWGLCGGSILHPVFLR